MRTPFVAGNWKMNTTVDEALDLVDAMAEDLKGIPDVEVVLCPPFVSLAVHRRRVRRRTRRASGWAPRTCTLRTRAPSPARSRR